MNEEKNYVTVADGAGNPPKKVEYCQGDTVAIILKKANISLEDGEAVTLGRKRIRNTGKTKVEPGDTLVIAGKVCNG